jgi:hypothetical protein
MGPRRLSWELHGLAKLCFPGMEGPDCGLLSSPHNLSVAPAVIVVSEKMQHAVDYQTIKFFLLRVPVFCGLGKRTRIGDHDLAKVRWCRRRRHESVRAIGHGKSQDIGGAVFPSILEIESSDAVVISDQQPHRRRSTPAFRFEGVSHHLNQMVLIDSCVELGIDLNAWPYLQRLPYSLSPPEHRRDT